MVERQEVEGILESALRITGSPDVDNDTLAALCRAWLKLEEAPVTELEWSDFNRGLWIKDPRMEEYAWEQRLTGQRVSIVPEGDQ